MPTIEVSDSEAAMLAEHRQHTQRTIGWCSALRAAKNLIGNNTANDGTGKLTLDARDLSIELDKLIRNPPSNL